MRILIVTHYFPPEIGAPQARLSELAALWAAAGDEVTVLTGMPNHPTGVVPDKYRRRLRMTEHVDGYRVVRTWLFATPNRRVMRRTLNHISFMITAALLGWRACGPADVVVVSSPTFFSIGAGWVLARMKRARLVVEIRDLWPAIFVELEVVTNRRLIAALEWLELAAYRAADKVVVVTEGFRANIVGRGIAADKVHVIRNGVDVDRFAPLDATSGNGEARREAESTADVRRRLGAAPAELLVVYIGAHGISHGLTAVADAAAKLAHDNVHVTFVGEGAAKGELTAHVAGTGSGNITLLPGVARSEVPAILAAADICLVPLRDVPLFDAFIPSKIFEYLAAGKPVVGAVRGEAAAILRDAGAVVVPPEDVDAMADAIARLAADPERRVAMAAAGRDYVTRHFDRRQLAAEYRQLLG